MSSYINQTTIHSLSTCEPNQLNRKGTMHGGEITKLLDDISGLCALQYNNSFMSTRVIHYVQMYAPVFPKENLKATATITRTGKTSLFLKSYLHRLEEGTETLIAEAGMTLVAVHNHRPIPVKPLTLVDEEAKREAKRAEEIVKLFKTYF